MDSTQPTCPVCGFSNFDVRFDLTKVSSAEDLAGRVARCRSCSMWFKVLRNPGGIPTAYPGECGEDEVAETYLQSETARSLFREALASVTIDIRGAKPRLLDVGAAQGTLLEEATKMGFDAEGVDHCEPNVAVARAKGLRVHCAAAESLEWRDTFDVITMMDLIEHTPEPMRLLRMAQRGLKPGGELIVYTPNHRAAIVALAKLLHGLGIRQPVQEIFGRNHVCFFDDLSLPAALERAGFEVRSRRLFPYDSARPGQYVSPLQLAIVTFVEALGRPFDRVFRMLIHARKPLLKSEAGGPRPGTGFPAHAFGPA